MTLEEFKAMSREDRIERIEKYRQNNPITEDEIEEEEAEEERRINGQFGHGA